MKEDGFDRRSFLKGAVVGGAAAVASSLPKPSEAQPKADAPPPPPAAYAFLNPEEAAFVEAVVDHMIPADEHSPKGSDLGLAVFIDRSLASGWGKRERLHLQAPRQAGAAGHGPRVTSGRPPPPSFAGGESPPRTPPASRPTESVSTSSAPPSARRS